MYRGVHDGRASITFSDDDEDEDVWFDDDDVWFLLFANDDDLEQLGGTPLSKAPGNRDLSKASSTPTSLLVLSSIMMSFEAMDCFLLLPLSIDTGGKIGAIVTECDRNVPSTSFRMSDAELFLPEDDGDLVDFLFDDDNIFRPGDIDASAKCEVVVDDGKDDLHF